ncbi:MAG: DUF2867 domain-containing protein [Dermatophilaceae bacterium]
MRVHQESRAVLSSLSADQVWAAVLAVGGENGWYSRELDALWHLRGLADRALGGVGMRRGRPSRDLRAGDHLDFWTVRSVCHRQRRLELVADMLLPGTATLILKVTSRGPGGCALQQTTVFQPAGGLGSAYWFASLPGHRLVFRRQVRAFLKAAERITASP